MSNTKKILLGIATLWPMSYLVFFFFFVFSQMFMTFFGGPSTIFPIMMLLIIPLHLFTMLLMLFLLIFYIKDIFGNNRVSGDKKALWAVVIFFGNMIAMPIYWYLYIYKKPTGQKGS